MSRTKEATTASDAHDADDDARDQIRYYLSGPSTVAERIQGLLDAGLERADIATAVGVRSEEAVRLWQNGKRNLHGRRYRMLDALRYTMLRMIERGMEPQRAASWFKSRHQLLGGATPCERFASDPDGVLGVALEDTDAVLRDHATGRQPRGLVAVSDG
jgi:hypothetical protein